jgi:hypothetical protein
MVRLEDNTTASDSPNLPLNDLGALKKLQGGEQAPTPVPLAVRCLRSRLPPPRTSFSDIVLGG